MRPMSHSPFSVQVEPRYLADQSSAKDNIYTFSYTVTVTNISDSCQLPKTTQDHSLSSKQPGPGSQTSKIGEILGCQKVSHNFKESDFPVDTGIRDDSITTNDRTWQIKLNGHDRFSARNAKYFTRTQIWQYHTGAGGVDSAATAGSGNCDDSIAIYSFALKPEEHQRSGTCNFSRIDNAQLVCSAAPGGTGYLFAVNYNVLRIMSGMGGLAYSN